MGKEKKLQVFVSSTYTDLREERQAAVETILQAGHIPAGMELFAAGDQSQMKVIRDWIKKSDVFMLILGGRYGSIEPESQKSYVQLEYEYAVELGKPLFSVVIEEEALKERGRRVGAKAMPKENPQKLKRFRKMVQEQRMVAKWSDPKDIKIAIYNSLRDLTEREDLVGWLRGDEPRARLEKVQARAAKRTSELENQIAALQEKIKILEQAQDMALAGRGPLQVEDAELEAAEYLDAITPEVQRAAFELALANVTQHGDTDVFPFPIESFVFFDRPAEAVSLLEEIHGQAPDAFRRSLDGFLHEEGFVAVGYNGFRWATQMDPLWNAYLLGLVIALGGEIERARIPAARNVVFSYRFKPDNETKTLFDREVGWSQFQRASLALAQQYSHVLICDIADYYLHVNHGHLYNALQRVAPGSRIVNRIMELLQAWSKGVGYGLPVGGPAARLLSELLLNDVDHLLFSGQVTFHRFVDDYHIFARSEQEARSLLVQLSDLLVKSSLSLQKSKTRILSAEEFRSLHDPEAAEDQAEALDRNVLSLRLHFDPYSPTRVEDYRALTEEMSKYPIEEMLARQMRKSRIDQAVTKKLIQMVKFQEAAARNNTVSSLLDNLGRLSPVFPTVMILLRGVMSDLEESIRQRAFKVLRELIAEGSHLLRVPVNLAFAVRVLAQHRSEEIVPVLASLYQTTESMMLRRDIILAMALNGANYWISAHLRDFDRATLWERRALLVASYTLGNEGTAFRRSVRNQLQPLDTLLSSWAAERLKRGQLEIPL